MSVVVETFADKANSAKTATPTLHSTVHRFAVSPKDWAWSVAPPTKAGAHGYSRTSIAAPQVLSYMLPVATGSIALSLTSHDGIVLFRVNCAICSWVSTIIQAYLTRSLQHELPLSTFVGTNP